MKKNSWKITIIMVKVIIWAETQIMLIIIAIKTLKIRTPLNLCQLITLSLKILLKIKIIVEIFTKKLTAEILDLTSHNKEWFQMAKAKRAKFSQCIKALLTTLLNKQYSAQATKVRYLHKRAVLLHNPKSMVIDKQHKKKSQLKKCWWTKTKVSNKNQKFFTTITLKIF